MDDLFCRCKNQPRPTSEETKTANGSNPTQPTKETKPANGSNRTQPTKICQRKRIQPPAEEQNPREEQPARAAIDAAVQCENEQRNRVNEMIKHGLVPHVQHAARFER